MFDVQLKSVSTTKNVLDPRSQCSCQDILVGTLQTNIEAWLSTGFFDLDEYLIVMRMAREGVNHCVDGRETSERFQSLVRLLGFDNYIFEVFNSE